MGILCRYWATALQKDGGRGSRPRPGAFSKTTFDPSGLSARHVWHQTTKPANLCSTPTHCCALPRGGASAWRICDCVAGRGNWTAIFGAIRQSCVAGSQRLAVDLGSLDAAQGRHCVGQESRLCTARARCFARSQTTAAAGRIPCVSQMAEYSCHAGIERPRFGTHWRLVLNERATYSL